MANQRAQERSRQDRQQQQLHDQQREIDRLKAEQRAQKQQGNILLLLYMTNMVILKSNE